VEPGDRVYAIDGVVIHDFQQLIREVNRSLDVSGDAPTSDAVEVEIIRDGRRFVEVMQPAVDDQPSIFGTKYRLLIGFERPNSTIAPGGMTTVRYGPVKAVRKGFERTGSAIIDTYTALSSLVRGLGNPRDAVGGPVAIFTVTGRSMMAGFHVFAGTIAVISVSLAIVNLLPVPALDGGQIVVFLFEWIRGRPLSAEIRMRIQMVGVVLLFTLLILVTANDVGRLIFPGV
jgi:regulator of sigma E protease